MRRASKTRLRSVSLTKLVYVVYSKVKYLTTQCFGKMIDPFWNVNNIIMLILAMHD